MYVHIHQDKECSSCGAINQTETVERGNNYWTVNCIETYLRCTRCGHEKLIYSTSNNQTNSPVSYTIEATNPKEIF